VAYKFQKLKDYFLNQHKECVDLTFEQIEKILGFKMCDSAYIHRAYWNHKSSPTHTFPKAWVEAGYETKDISKIKDRKMSFIRK
jgi:hypothetical protein